MNYSTRDKLEKSARELLYGSALFFPLRSAYQHVFNRQKLLVRRKTRDFYASFVRRGDLVFDTGANVGGYLDVFCVRALKGSRLNPILNVARTCGG
jgi:hypothetical protein